MSINRFIQLVDMSFLSYIGSYNAGDNMLVFIINQICSTESLLGYTLCQTPKRVKHPVVIDFHEYS